MKRNHLFLWAFTLILLTPSLARTRDAVSAAEVNGTFTHPSGSTFEILALAQGKLQVQYSGIYPYRTANGERTANLGEAGGVADINADKAVFKPEGFEKSCSITLHFVKPGELQVTQDGDSPDCGFGLHVRADGTYRKTSSKKPLLKSK